MFIDSLAPEDTTEVRNCKLRSQHQLVKPKLIDPSNACGIWSILDLTREQQRKNRSSLSCYPARVLFKLLPSLIAAPKNSALIPMRLFNEVFHGRPHSSISSVRIRGLFQNIMSWLLLPSTTVETDKHLSMPLVKPHPPRRHYIPNALELVG